MIYTVANTAIMGNPVKVFVDGKEIKDAFYADTDKGLVKFYKNPIRLTDSTDQIAEAEISGNVCVVPDGD